MIDSVVGLDHVLVSVPDIDSASTALEHIGFSLTPKSHITTMGLANRLVLLEPLVDGVANFVELMSVTDPSSVPGPMAALLSEYGPRSTILATSDALATSESLRRNGIDLVVPHHVRRMWRRPDGAEAWPEFEVILPKPDGLAFNYCQYRNIELYHEPQWRGHPNGAVSLTAVGVRSKNPEQLAAHLAELSAARGPVTRSTGMTPDEVTLRVPTPSGVDYNVALGTSADTYDGIAVSVRSLDATSEHLMAQQIPHAAIGGSIVVAAADSCGIGITFHEVSQVHRDA